ncbi:MAG: 16S rRNA (cytidine(1402)-2'-O)-methyltransferase [bacterium]
MPILYVIALPIGNLEDLSFRALRILKEVDLILCEDTRITNKLLSHYEISKPLISYHQHSKITKNEYVAEQIKQGKNLALVSDAGTPCVSDPGSKLIDYLLKQFSDLKIVPIPGPSALIAGLSVSGFPADKFVFCGFPPVKNKRKKFFEKIEKTKKTVVFYESPYRILKTLKELNTKKEIVVCRELTKKFETIYRGSAKEIIEKLQKEKIKGEFVVILRGI